MTLGETDIAKNTDGNLVKTDLEGSSKPVRVFDFKHLRTTKEVSVLIDVHPATIRKAKNKRPERFLEGRHWIYKIVETNRGEQLTVYWTQRGIIQLIFLVKSETANVLRIELEEDICNILEKHDASISGFIQAIKDNPSEYVQAKKDSLHYQDHGSVAKKCVDCGRLLTLEESIARGKGHTCWQKSNGEGTLSGNSVSSLPSPGIQDIIPSEELVDSIVEPSNIGPVKEKLEDFSPKLQLKQFYYCFTETCANFHGSSSFRSPRKGDCLACSHSYRTKSR